MNVKILMVVIGQVEGEYFKLNKELKEKTRELRYYISLLLLNGAGD